jgi:hypothetical protein
VGEHEQVEERGSGTFWHAEQLPGREGQYGDKD